jgi:hypothetical protein
MADGEVGYVNTFAVKRTSVPQADTAALAAPCTGAMAGTPAGSGAAAVRGWDERGASAGGSGVGAGGAAGVGDGSHGRANVCVRWARQLKLSWRLVRESPWYHQLFVAIVVAQILVHVVGQSILLAQNWGVASRVVTPGQRQELWFFAVIVISAAFAGYYGIHAMLSVNSFELGTFFATSLLLVIRTVAGIVNAASEEECSAANRGICFGFVGAVLVLNGLSMVMCVVMYRDLKWKRYKAIGAARSTRAMYQVYEAFVAVKKLDLQFSVILLVTGLVFFTDITSATVRWTLALNVVLFAIEGVWDYAADRATKTEHVVWMQVRVEGGGGGWAGAGAFVRLPVGLRRLHWAGSSASGQQVLITASRHAPAQPISAR